MSDVQILHNPRCSKSRQTLALLQEQGIQPTIIDYLNQTWTADDIKKLMAGLNISDPLLMMRTTEPQFKEMGLNDSKTSADDLISAMCQVPKLIERPIVINGQQARIGRPPESVLAIL